MSETLCTINGTDITKYIIKNTYEVNTEPVFESWDDGNFREHRIYIRDRVKGKFDVIFFDDDNGAYQNFLTLLNSATSNRMTLLGLFVENTASFEALQAYIHIEAQQHAECSDGRTVNKMTLNIEEY